MSKLENLVVSLGTAQKLVEAGIKVDSYWHWFNDCDGSFVGYINKEGVYPFRNFNEPYYQYPAPTFEELEKYTTKDYQNFNIKLNAHYNEGKTMIEFYDLYHEHKIYLKSQWYEKKADALAEILIELKEEGKLDNSK